MWGLANKGFRLGARQRPLSNDGVRLREQVVGVTRITARGPMEHTVVELANELDFTNIDEIVDAIGALPGNVVAIDISGLEFVDSTAVMGLNRLCRRIGTHTAGGSSVPVLQGAREAVAKTMQLVNQLAPDAIVDVDAGAATLAH